MTGLRDTHPDRFPGLIAAVMSNPDAMVEKARRTIEDLRPGGMRIFATASGKPLDRPGSEPFCACIGT